MKAVVLTRPAPIESGPLRLEELSERQPGAGQIVIQVRACGVCRSNLHMVEGDWVDGGVPAYTPIIPGHEVVGTVSALGDGVTHLQVGDRVGVQPLWSTCGACPYCRSGREQLCQAKQITGETVDGGYAEQMLATAAHSYVLPDALDDVEAAPLFCPGITAYGAVAKARLSPAKSVAVFGVGGVGHVALQFAKLTGAETVAVTPAVGAGSSCPRSSEPPVLSMPRGVTRARCCVVRAGSTRRWCSLPRTRWCARRSRRRSPAA